MSLHKYAPESIQEFLAVLKVLPVTVSKARSSHTVHVTIPMTLIEPLRDTANDFGLQFSIGRFYRSNKCQIVVKAA